MLRVVLPLLTAVLCAPSASAKLVAFGDSLTDRQNFYLASGLTVPDPLLYADGRFSNGPLWIEHLADRLGETTPTASLMGGHNYAFNASRVSNTSPAPFASVPNIDTQVGGYLLAQGNTASPTDLHTFWGGANDFFFGQTDPTVPVASLGQNITNLYNAGARRFLVLNLPPLGKTPFFRGGPSEVPLDTAAATFNALLAAELAQLRADLPGARIDEVDVFGLFGQAIAKPTAFGLSNVHDSATHFDPVTGLGTSLAVANPNDYLFWDSVHPTATIHEVIGEAAFAVVVPEPASLLLTLGLAGLALLRARSRNLG